MSSTNGRSETISQAGVLELRCAARLENLAVLRAVVGAVAAFEDLDFDAVADLRLAVDEACTRLISSAASDTSIDVLVEPRKDTLVIEVSAQCDSSDFISPGSFSWHVLTALTDEVWTFQKGQDSGNGRIFGIALSTKRTGVPR